MGRTRFAHGKRAIWPWERRHLTMRTSVDTFQRRFPRSKKSSPSFFAAENLQKTRQNNPKRNRPKKLFSGFEASPKCVSPNVLEGLVKSAAQKTGEVQNRLYAAIISYSPLVAKTPLHSAPPSYRQVSARRRRTRSCGRRQFPSRRRPRRSRLPQDEHQSFVEAQLGAGRNRAVRTCLERAAVDGRLLLPAVGGGVRALDRI